jgi:putative peptidoglycan lipid II flippase
MGLFALAMGILNSRRHFFAPSFAPVFLNICMILSVLLFFFRVKPPILTLAFGVLAGGFLQFLFQIPFLLKKGITFRFNFDVRHPAIRRIGLLMVPGLIGTAVYQLNVFIDTIFASFLPRGSVSYLYYADRLMEFPLGIFAVAMGMAALPSFSELASRGRKEELSETVSFAFRLVSFISVPALVGLIALKTPIINLLFQRGVFDEHATQMTARALLCYCVGLLAIAGVRTVVPAFYALQDTRTPLKIGVVCLGANVILIAVLIVPLRHAGLALATSLSSILNLVLLSRELKKALGKIDFRKDIESLIRHFACSVPMGFVAYLICSSREWTQTGDSLSKLFLLVIGIGVGAGVYLACCYVIRDEEILFLLKMVKRKRRP